MDAYKVLGLREGASEEEVKAAYRTLAQKYNPESYEAGPLRDDAQARMDELNAAFDEIMTQLRTGTTRSTGAAGGAATEPGAQYAEIRTMINNGQADAALQRLNGIVGGPENGEWNFLVGSAYYYKGWLADAQRYFQTACRLAPQNREYAAALRNLQSSANGNMNGSPYQNRYAQNGGTQTMGCSCCDMCTAMICMDMCCGGSGCC